jgi:outer membrane protein assembly factor BamE (lipoprotein component of BamABCDE complex)
VRRKLRKEQGDMRKLASVLAVAAIVAALVVSSGTSFSANTEDVESAQKSESDDRIIGTIPPDSPFAKISIGMSQKHVYDLIGRPTDSKVYRTGKGFIPFYYGTDRHRVEAFYKGMGRITFASHKVYRIIYDPTEKGYADSE